MNKSKWTLEACKEDALKYTSRWAWNKASNNRPYKTARVNGWLDICCAHMPQINKPPNYWTIKENCIIDAHKFNDRTIWQITSHSAYKSACDNGWLSECTMHMIDKIKPKGTWTLQTCKIDAKIYKTISAWQEGSPSGYQTAFKRGWLAECSEHMTKSCLSRPEQSLREEIKALYPNADSKFFTQNGKRMQLDIYIPELNKGIEFNGDYWHGEGMIRQGINPHQYHANKKQFFQSINISYIEIWESEWNTNKDLCLSKAKEFLFNP